MSDVKNVNFLHERRVNYAASLDMGGGMYGSFLVKPGSLLTKSKATGSKEASADKVRMTAEEIKAAFDVSKEEYNKVKARQKVGIVDLDKFDSINSGYEKYKDNLSKVGIVNLDEIPTSRVKMVKSAFNLSDSSNSLEHETDGVQVG